MASRTAVVGASGPVAERRPGWGRWAQLGLAYLALSVGSLWALFPFLWMISTSLKSESEVLAYPPTWIPNQLAWGNYAEVTRLLARSGGS